MHCSVSRRRFLQEAAALSGSALLLRYGRVQAASPVLGLELYTLGEAVGKDLPGTLHEVAQMGYRTVELPESYGLSAKDLRQALDAAGLAAPSLHAPLQGLAGKWNLSGELPRVIADAKTIGAQYVVVGGPQLPDNLSRLFNGHTPSAEIANAFKAAPPDSFMRTADALNKSGAALKRAGLGLAYHNHNIEFLPLSNGHSGFDILLANTDPQYVDFEVDIGWVVAAGQDAVELLERVGTRAKLLHLKDTKTSKSDRLGMIPADAGTGIVPWQKIAPIIHRNRIPFLYVEQEPPFTSSPKEAARVAFAYFSKVLA